MSSRKTSAKPLSTLRGGLSDKFSALIKDPSFFERTRSFIATN